jgi:SAM-dependent methyltransferase
MAKDRPGRTQQSSRGDGGNNGWEVGDDRPPVVGGGGTRVDTATADRRPGPGGLPGPGADREMAPRKPLALYGRQLVWNTRRRLRAEVKALRAPDHPFAADQSTRFGDLYATQDDPFHYSTHAYELRKYDLTVAVLPSGRFEWAYELGCSIGELTARLAPRCGTLLAGDVSEDALVRAARRLRGADNVVFEQHLLPRDYPSGRFDLVVMSEIGYYLEPDALKDLVRRVTASLAPGGHLLAVHGRGVSADIYWPGDIVHRHLLLTTGLRRMAAYKEEAFRIDLFRND